MAKVADLAFSRGLCEKWRTRGNKYCYLACIYIYMYVYVVKCKKLTSLLYDKSLIMKLQEVFIKRSTTLHHINENSRYPSITINCTFYDNSSTFEFDNNTLCRRTQQ